jgi:hypothetical protein
MKKHKICQVNNSDFTKNFHKEAGTYKHIHIQDTLDPPFQIVKNIWNSRIISFSNKHHRPRILTETKSVIP